jgi:hypothetical protein
MHRHRLRADGKGFTAFDRSKSLHTQDQVTTSDDDDISSPDRISSLEACHTPATSLFFRAFLSVILGEAEDLLLFFALAFLSVILGEAEDLLLFFGPPNQPSKRNARRMGGRFAQQEPNLSWSA